MKCVRGRRGSAILMVVLFIFVLSLTGMAILYMNGRQEMSTVHDIKDVVAYQAAQTGLELARAWFIARCNPGVSGNSPNKFPEHINHNSNPIVLFVDGTHPTGTWVLGDCGINAGGSTSYRVRVVPCSDNDVNIAANTGKIGNYVVISSGIVTTEVTGSYDYIKVTSETIRVHFWTDDNSYRLRVVNNSWVEEPVRRVVH